MTEIVITKERWDKLIFVAEQALNGSIYAIEEDLWEFSSEERMLLITVLKNSTPFEVCESSHEGIENKPFNVVEK